MSSSTKLLKQLNLKKILHLFFSAAQNFLKANKMQPTYILGVASIILIFVLWLVGSSKPQSSAVISNDYLNEKPTMSGVKSAVDPRAYWASELSNEMKKLETSLTDSLDKYSEEIKGQIEILEQRIENLENAQGQQVELTNKNMGLPAFSDTTQNKTSQSRRKFGHIKRISTNVRKNIMDYIPVGSFARGVLLTGIVVGTGIESASKRKQVMIRLVDHAIFSKANYNEQIKEAVIIGSCEGNISSERAECRLESLSLKNNSGQIIENYAVQGWLNGEDGLPGIRGEVVDKSSDVARMALLTGMLGGMSQFFQNQATNGIFPISPITGQQHALKTSDALKASSFAGAGNALNEISRYIIKKAEQLNPVIVVASGRLIDVVFMKGFELRATNDKQPCALMPTPTGVDYNKDRGEHVSFNTHGTSNEQGAF